MPSKRRWKGEGNPDNPYIIESPHSLPNEFIIKDSSLHITMKNCRIEYLTLKRCQNLKFEECTFELSEIIKCYNISINDCSLNLSLDISKSQNSLISNLIIDFLKIARSIENHFKSCFINQISNLSTRANIFEDIIMSLQDFSSIMEGGSRKMLLGTLIFPVIGIDLLSVVIARFGGTISAINLWLLEGGIILMVFFEITIALTLYLDHKKMQKFPPNRIE